MRFIRRSFHALVATWFALIGAASVQALEPSVRIMPLGDSITKGVAEPGAQGGYRDLLYSTLTLAGYNVDFIGTFTDTNNPDLPDRDHQGLQGARVDEVNLKIGEWLNELEDPDVVLIQIGTNDFLQTWRNETPNGVLAELNTLITAIATKRPFCKIIVSTLILTTSSSTVEAKQVQFNAGIPGLVAQHVAMGRQVSWVDLHPVLDAGDLYDDVHPTTAGYEKMAQAWAPAIQAVISPQGTANPPMIARVETMTDPTHVSLDFSKPVADSSANPANFTISGGLTVSSAVLDTTTKRTITLTTSPQTPGEAYTLTASGVRDRTAPQHLIAPQSKVKFYPNILSNSSFENDFAGWTHTGNQVIKDSVSDFPYSTNSGTRMVAFNSLDSTPNGVLSQSFATQPGRTYYLSFDLGSISWRNSWTQKMSVAAQGTTNILQTTSTISGTGGGGTVKWFPWGYQFTADSAATTLTFTDISNTNGSFDVNMLLDNVRLGAQRTANLAVTSTPNGGPVVTISPNDIHGNGAGFTGLIRSFNPGTSVTLTAPASFAGRNFLKWQINGADLPGSNPAVTVTVSADTALNAVYDAGGGPIAPVAVADSYTMDENTQLLVAGPGVLLNDTDADALPLTAVPDAGPSHGSLVLNGDGSFSYSPAANFTGVDSFTYHAGNGTLDSNTALVEINVAEPNSPPVALDDGDIGTPFATVAEDSGISAAIMVLANDTDADSDPLSISSAISPNGLVSISSGSLRLIPDANFCGMTAISYTISDGMGGISSATAFVMVTPLNDAPVAVNDGSVGAPFVTMAEDSGTSAALTVLANDTDVDLDPLSITTATSPNGVVTINMDQTLSFTPTANFHGAATISYTISDGHGGISGATVFLMVTPVNDPPVANDQSLGTDEDTPLPITLTGSDIEGDAVSSFTVTAFPQHGTLTGSSANRTYTPNANYYGPDSFSFTCSDGFQTSNAATVTITVHEVGGNPLTEWLAGYGLAAGPGADSDHDSISNAVEYVIGGIPNNPMDAGLLPSATRVMEDPDGDTIFSDYLLFTYRRTDRAKSDPWATIQVEWCQDPAGPWTIANETHGEVIIVEDNQAGPATDRVKVYIPKASAGQLFARLKVIVAE